MKGRGRGIRARKLEAPRPRRALTSQSSDDGGLTSPCTPPVASDDPVLKMVYSRLPYLAELDSHESLELRDALTDNGMQLDMMHQDQMDIIFKAIRRNLMEASGLGTVVRVHLLQLLEARQAGWADDGTRDKYFQRKTKEMAVRQRATSNSSRHGSSFASLHSHQNGRFDHGDSDSDGTLVESVRQVTKSSSVALRRGQHDPAGHRVTRQVSAPAAISDAGAESSAAADAQRDMDRRSQPEAQFRLPASAPNAAEDDPAKGCSRSALDPNNNLANLPGAKTLGVHSPPVGVHTCNHSPPVIGHTCNDCLAPGSGHTCNGNEPVSGHTCNHSPPVTGHPCKHSPPMSAPTLPRSNSAPVNSSMTLDHTAQEATTQTRKLSIYGEVLKLECLDGALLKEAVVVLHQHFTETRSQAGTPGMMLGPANLSGSSPDSSVRSFASSRQGPPRHDLHPQRSRTGQGCRRQKDGSPASQSSEDISKLPPLPSDDDVWDDEDDACLLDALGSSMEQLRLNNINEANEAARIMAHSPNPLSEELPKAFNVNITAPAPTSTPAVADQSPVLRKARLDFSAIAKSGIVPDDLSPVLDSGGCNKTSWSIKSYGDLNKGRLGSCDESARVPAPSSHLDPPTSQVASRGAADDPDIAAMQRRVFKHSQSWTSDKSGSISSPRSLDLEKLVRYEVEGDNSYKFLSSWYSNTPSKSEASDDGDSSRSRTSSLCESLDHGSGSRRPRGTYGSNRDYYGYRQPDNIVRPPLGPMASAAEIQVAERLLQDSRPLSACSRRKHFHQTSQDHHKSDTRQRTASRRNEPLRYGTNFLLACSRSPAAKKLPSDWTFMAKVLPEVCLTECHQDDPSEVAILLSMRNEHRT